MLTLSRRPCCRRVVTARKVKREPGVLAGPTRDRNKAAMLLGYNVVVNRAPKTGSFAVGLVVTNRWNNLSRISGAIPAPLSRIRISTSCPRAGHNVGIEYRWADVMAGPGTGGRDPDA